MVMQMVGTIAFSGAAAAAGWTLWASVAPQWERIVRLAMGQADPVGSPLAQLARAERRIAVRARVTASRAPAQTWRAAA